MRRYKSPDYPAAIRALVTYGDYTRFSQLLELAPVGKLAKAAGMGLSRFNKILQTDLAFDPEAIRGLSDHLGLPIAKILVLIDEEIKNRQ